MLRDRWMENLPEGEDRRVTNGLLHEIKDAGNSDGTKVIFLVIPSLEDIKSGTKLAEKYAAYFEGTNYSFPYNNIFTKSDYDNIPASKHFNNSGHFKFYQFAKAVIDKEIHIERSY